MTLRVDNSLQKKMENIQQINKHASRISTKLGHHLHTSVSQISIMRASYLRFCAFSLFWHQRLADLQK